jgi:hypothetical protein
LAFKTKHFSLLTPRDYDFSPYFAIFKTTVECGFNFCDLEWVLYFFKLVLCCSVLPAAH